MILGSLILLCTGHFGLNLSYPADQSARDVPSMLIGDVYHCERLWRSVDSLRG
jgi:hypothetical protein